METPYRRPFEPFYERFLIHCETAKPYLAYLRTESDFGERRFRTYNSFKAYKSRFLRMRRERLRKKSKTIDAAPTNVNPVAQHR